MAARRTHDFFSVDPQRRSPENSLVEKKLPYRLVVEQHPAYLHASVTGEHNAANALRFLTESITACAESGQVNLLLEFNLAGPSLDSTSIFAVTARPAQMAAKLRRIAYVDTSSRDPAKMKFAETVAQNRGVNVRLFRELEAAKRWLAEGTEKA
jgi:hypothetical protein